MNDLCRTLGPEYTTRKSNFIFPNFLLDINITICAVVGLFALTESIHITNLSSH